MFTFPVAHFSASGGLVEIEKSALFSTTSQELERTPSSAGNVDKWTFSTWVYFCDSTNPTSIPIFGAYQNSSNQNAILLTNTGQIYFQIYLGASHVGRLKTTQLLRDTAFYHIVVVYDSGNAVAGNREIIYLNGERVTDFATETYVSQNQDGLICGTHLHQVGLFDGLSVSGNLYMAETVLLDNTVTSPTSFGELSDNGYWTPLASTTIQELTFGANGFYCANKVADAPQLDFRSGDDNTVILSQYKSLLHFDGSDTSTTFTDSSSSSSNWTASGNAQLDTAQKKFGTASLLLDGTGDYAYHASLATVGTQNFTIDFWVRRNGANTNNALLTWGDSGADTGLRILTSTDNKLIVSTHNAAVIGTGDHSTSLPDGEFAHVEMVRSGSTLYLFQNGTLLSSKSFSYNLTSTSQWWIGDDVNSSGPSNFNGHIDEVRVAIGYAAHTSGFTAPTSAYSNPPTANNWTNTGSVTTVSSHTPSVLNNLWNPLASFYNGSTFSNGNRTVVTGSSEISPVQATIPIHSGKWYCEVVPQSSEASFLIGLTKGLSTANNQYLGQLANDVGYYGNGNVYLNGSSAASYGASYAQNDVIGMAINLDDNQITYYKNGASQGALSLPAASTVSTPYFVACGHYWSAGTGTYLLRSSSSDWTGTAPTGYKALTSANLTAPSESQLSDHFATKLYTGDGNASNELTFGGANNMQPDFVWIKNRSVTSSQQVHDSLRGVTKELNTNTNGAEYTNADGLIGFDTDGFEVGADAWFNGSGNSLVAWCIKAGGAPTATNSEAQGDAPTSGSYMIDGSASTANTIGTADITKLSVNTKLGFSCGLYNGSNSDTTLQTGLTDCKMIIIKRLNATYNWAVWHEGLTDDHSLFLNTNAAQANNSYFDTSENTSTLFHLEGNSNATSIAGGTFAFWAFCESDYINISSYEGNGNADGQFIPTGYIQAEWAIIKNIDSAQSWWIRDTIRNPYNIITGELHPDLNNAEYQSGTMDIGTGFIKNRSSSDSNASASFVYMAIGHPILSKSGLIRQGR